MGAGLIRTQIEPVGDFFRRVERDIFLAIENETEHLGRHPQILGKRAKRVRRTSLYAFFQLIAQISSIIRVPGRFHGLWI